MAVLFALFAMLSHRLRHADQRHCRGAGDQPSHQPAAYRNGIIFGIITAIIIIGGIESIAVVCEKLVPLIWPCRHVVGCIVILCANYDFLLPALKAIFVPAFKPGAVTGGLVGGDMSGAAVRRGTRPVSNEFGMGSAPLVASAAQTRNPVRQALVSATGTFWTTVVVCLMTGLVLVSSMMKNPAVSVENMANGGQMTTAAFAQIPYIGLLDGQHHYVRVLHHPRMVLRRACR